MPRKGENIYHRKDGRWEGRYKSEAQQYRYVYGHSYLEVKNRLAKLRSVAPKLVLSGKLTVGSKEWYRTMSNVMTKVNRSVVL